MVEASTRFPATGSPADCAVAGSGKQIRPKQNASALLARTTRFRGITMQRPQKRRRRPIPASRNSLRMAWPQRPTGERWAAVACMVPLLLCMRVRSGTPLQSSLRPRKRPQWTGQNRPCGHLKTGHFRRPDRRPVMPTPPPWRSRTEPRSLSRCASASRVASRTGMAQ